MAIQIITVGAQELQDIITDAYKEGYIKAQREWQEEQTRQQQEPQFHEIIRGVKELREYLLFKDYWVGSVSTLSKIAPQLLEEGDKVGHRLTFRRTCIDYLFEKGFQFKPIKKKGHKEVISV